MKHFSSWRKRNQAIWGLVKFFSKVGGEIFIIGLGIFLGLEANNWNQNRLEQRHLEKVHERVVSGIENDIAEMEGNLKRYNQIEPLFLSVQGKSATPDLLEKRITKILIETEYTVFSYSGVEQLKALPVQDSLSLAVIEVYEEMQNYTITPFEESILEESKTLKNHFRDSYSWYPEWIRRSPSRTKSSKELQDYFLSSEEYRNFVIARYQIIYEDYLPSLNYYIEKLKKLRDELEKTYSHKNRA